MLHIGLRFFEAQDPVKHFARHPQFFLDALKGGRQSMLGVSEHLVNPGARILPYRMCFPVYRDGPYQTWQLRAGLKLLSMLGQGRASLDYQIIKQKDAEKIPFFDDFREPDKLDAIACYNEFKFDWPERFCVDMLLDAKRNGATVLNYCRASIKEQKADRDWVVSLQNVANEHAASVEVHAPIVLNLAGTWTDDVFPSVLPKPIIQQSKGSLIVVELPETYSEFGIAGLNRHGTPFYVLPLHKHLFSVGVTELPFEGDARNVSCTDAEIDFLIEEFNSLLPGRRLGRKDVVSTWAGIRALTPSEDGLETRSRRLHDLTSRGYPGILALTGAPIMSHRSTGRLILQAVSAKLKPSGKKGEISYEPFAFSNRAHSPAFLADEPEIRIADLENSVEKEFAKTLIDVLLRRTSLAWRRRLTWPQVQKAADIVGPLLDWSDKERRTQVEQFMKFQQDVFHIPDTEGHTE